MRLLFALLFSFSLTGIFAQQAQITTGNMAGFNYLAQNNKGKSVLIVFHYSAGTPEEALSNYDQLSPEVRIIAVKGNYKKRNGYSYLPVNYYSKTEVEKELMLKETCDSLAIFIKHFNKISGVMPVVSGISQGGDIALYLALYYSDLIKAAFPFAALFPTRAMKNLKEFSHNKTPIAMFQGTSDPIVKLELTELNLAKFPKKTRPKLYTYANLGHDISPEMKRDYSLQISRALK